MGSPKKYAVVVAGGKGTRMQAAMPKQFLLLGGRPILMRAIEAFKSYDSAVQIIIVLPKPEQIRWQRLCEEYEFRVPCRIAEGGASRFQSVANALGLIPDDEPDALIAVHDGVRPFVTKSIISACFEAAERAGAAVPVIELADSLRKVDGSTSVAVSRSDYRAVQTPQTFRADVLKRAYRLPFRPEFTDDASVVEASGHELALVAGCRENFKITTPTDLVFAQALLSRNGER